MKTARTILLLLAASVAPTFASGPAWDASGNSQLSGTYYFRQVLYVGAAGGSISQAVAFSGNIVFSGTTTGTYTITNGTAIVSGSNPQLYSTSGTYSNSASGYGVMTSPLAVLFPTGVSTNLSFLVSNGILIGSGTETGYNDLLIAAPYSSSLSLGSLSGAYTISTFFPGGSPATSLGGTYQLNLNGSTSVGNVSISGYNGSGSAYTQTASGVTMKFSNGAYLLSFPSNGNGAFYQGTAGSYGQPILYSSPDSNFVFGGTTYGFDMLVGVKNSASGTNTPLSGLYYEAGIDDNANSGLDTYYGTFNAIQSQGALIGHERLLNAGYAVQGYTYSASYPTSITGSYTDQTGTVTYTFNSQTGIRIGYGTGGYLGIAVALPYKSPSPSRSVYIDPTGVVNTASSAPYTAGVSPGDFITIYGGQNLANGLVAAPPGAFPTSGLGGVTVTVDGLPAPLYYVSPTQISFLIPYQASVFPIASIQVNNNGNLSNVVTTNMYLTTPGVFSYNTGIGDAAVIDYPAAGGSPFLVNENHPATGGDTIVAFLSGLGAPFPTNPDGALGVYDYLVQNIAVSVSGVSVGTPAYIGLAPGLAGLYQINFTLPGLCSASGQTGCLDLGDNSLTISGPDSTTNEVLLPIGAGGTAAIVSSTPVSAVSTARQTLPRLQPAKRP